MGTGLDLTCILRWGYWRALIPLTSHPWKSRGGREVLEVKWLSICCCSPFSMSLHLRNRISSSFHFLHSLIISEASSLFLLAGDSVCVPICTLICPKSCWWCSPDRDASWRLSRRLYVQRVCTPHGQSARHRLWFSQWNSQCRWTFDQCWTQGRNGSE